MQSACAAGLITPYLIYLTLVFSARHISVPREKAETLNLLVSIKPFIRLGRRCIIDTARRANTPERVADAAFVFLINV